MNTAQYKATEIITAPTLLIVGGAYMMAKIAGSVISSAIKKEKKK